jgi:hypothetical protein
LYLRPTAGMFVLLMLALVLHELAYAADLKVALSRREIPALEQWVHGFQHLLPWAGLAGLLALSPAQTRALLGLSAEVPDWSLRLKDVLPSGHYIAALLAAALIFNVLPFMSEAWRSAKVWRGLDRNRPGCPSP